MTMKSKSSPNPTLDWTSMLCLMLPPLLWAGNFIVGRSVRDIVPPMALVFYRWILALACLLPFAWRSFRRDLPLYWTHRWQLIGVSATGLAAFNALVYVGLQSTSAANGLLLNSFIPLLIAGLGALLYRQKLLPNQWLGILISFCGVLVIVAHGSWQTLAAMRIARGDGYVFLATVCWAFYTLWLRSIPVSIDRRGLMMAQILIALAMLLPLLIAEQLAGHHVIWSAHSLLAIGYIGIFPSVIAFMLYGAAVVRVGAARAGLFIHLIPVFGALLSVALLREPIHAWQLAGMLVIFAGVACANRGQPRAA